MTTTITQKTPAASRTLLEDVVPLTPLQQGIYFHSSLALDDTEDDVYVVQMVLELHSAPGSELNVDVLRRSAQVLLDRHANLRTCFRLRKTGEPIGVVLRTAEVPWSTIDLRTLPADERDDAMAAAIAADGRRRFDPAVAPLLRFTSITVGPHRSMLVFTSHHLLLDGWSAPLLMRELFEVYAAGGDAAVLPPVRPFKNYLTWLASQNIDEGVSTWANYLDGVEGPTTVGPDGASRTPEMPLVHHVPVPETTGSAVVDMARRTGVTANTVVQTAWAVLLGSLTGRTDVTFGAVVSGRVPDVPGIESMIGLFINTVPVRVRLDPRDTAELLLSRVRAEQVSVMDHQHVGLADISRRIGRSELFDTVVVFESYPVDSAALARAQNSGGITVASVKGRDATNFPLALVAQIGTGLELTIEYQPSLFTAELVREYGARLADIVAFLTGPSPKRLGAFPIWPAVLPPVADGWLPVPASTMLDAVGDVPASPDAVAVVSGEESLTFADLDRRSNRLARRLIGLGVGPEVPVAVGTTRSVEGVLALWATIKAGGVYVPLDPSYPSDRLRGMLDDVRPVAVLATKATVQMLASAAESICPVLTLDGEDDIGRASTESDAALTERDRLGRVQPDSAMYVIFTSGSTGRPKGVCVTHRGLAALLSSHRRVLHHPVAAKAGRTNLAVAHAWSFGFDASWQPLLWMFSGHTVVIADNDTMRDPDALVRMIVDHRIGFVELTPSVLGRAIEAGLLSDPHHRPAAVGFGGEAVGDALWTTLRESGVMAVNLYGPTESTVDALVAHVSDTPRPTIGSAVDGSRARVVDRWLRPVAQGTAGELYVSGAGLARGYIGAAGITAARFVADPFGEPGSRMYRTGDVVTVREDNRLRFFGRADDQVKIRGHRVELGEIETVLHGMDGVAQAVVVARRNGPATTRLVGYVAAAPGSNVTVSELRAALAATLPDYMVPAAIVSVDRFATTANGKIDRNALPEPDFDALVSDTEPRNDVEATIASVFADALGLDRVGIDDDFFELGGDSIVSIQLVSLIRAAGLHVTARTVFDGRTVAGIAARVSAGPVTRSAPSRPVGDVPLTPVVASTIARGGSFARFSQARLLIAPPAATHADLAAAAQSVLDTHAILRSVLTTSGDEMRWTVREPGAVTGDDVVRTVDIRGCSRQEFMDILGREREVTFAEMNPAAGNILRMVWFDNGSEPGRLLVVVHHLAVDGVSWRILVPDLAAAWNAVSRGRAPELPPPGTSFREWARGLQSAATSERLRAQKPLWAAVDAAAEQEPQLGERPLDSSRDFVGDVTYETSPISRATSSAVLDHASANRVGVDHVLAAALAVTVRRVTGNDRPVRVDVESHGRTEELVDGADLSRTVGWFTAIAPVLLDITEANSIEDAVFAVAEHMRAIPDNGVGHGALVCFDGEPSGAEPSQILFDYLGRSTLGEKHGEPWSGAPEVGALGGTIDPRTPASHVLQFDAIVEDSAEGPLLVCEWAGTRGVLTPERTRRMALTFADVLTEMTTPTAKGQS